MRLQGGSKVAKIEKKKITVIKNEPYKSQLSYLNICKYFQ